MRKLHGAARETFDEQWHAERECGTAEQGKQRDFQKVRRDRPVADFQDARELRLAAVAAHDRADLLDPLRDVAEAQLQRCLGGTGGLRGLRFERGFMVDEIAVVGIEAAEVGVEFELQFSFEFCEWIGQR